MKIAVRGGHNEKAQGANGIVNEVIEDRKITAATIKHLRLQGHTVYDVTPGPMESNSDLAFGVNKANDLNVDLFLSIHANKAYEIYKGKIGSEVCVYAPFNEAKRVAKTLYNLGFTDDKGNMRRASTNGLNINKSLYELRRTKMKAMIIECFFLEATGDVDLYKRLGSDALGKAIAEGVCGKSSTVTTSTPAAVQKPAPKPQKRQLATWEININGDIIRRLQTELNNQFGARLVVDAYCGDATIAKLITVRKGARGNITKIIQELLIRKGYSVGKYGADSVFGNGTYNAVCAIQRDNGLVVDGVVGINTWKVLLRK